MKNVQLNADRFKGFADVYDNARPNAPEKVKDIILNYLGKKPSLVVDLGCGTGLSTGIWNDVSEKVIGIEPSRDMIKVAKDNFSGRDNINFISAFSDNTGLEKSCADIITCSQSFHWMNPVSTLNEVARILKCGGVFAVYDYDWPPVCNWEAEAEYARFLDRVKGIEVTHPDVKDSFIRWDKNKHLDNIKNSGKFRYVREIVFSNTENCDTQRFIALALSQGGFQAVLKADYDKIYPYLNAFKEKITYIFKNKNFTVDFCYRMRIGIK